MHKFQSNFIDRIIVSINNTLRLFQRGVYHSSNATQHAACNITNKRDSAERAESRDKPVLARDKTEKMDSRRHDL